MTYAIRGSVSTISTLVLVVCTIFSITSGIIFVIVVGIVSRTLVLLIYDPQLIIRTYVVFFKLLVLVLATLPLVAIATDLLVGANMVLQSIVSTISVCRNAWDLVNQTSLLL